MTGIDAAFGYETNVSWGITRSHDAATSCPSQPPEPDNKICGVNKDTFFLSGHRLRENELRELHAELWLLETDVSAAQNSPSQQHLNKDEASTGSWAEVLTPGDLKLYTGQNVAMRDD